MEENNNQEVVNVDEVVPATLENTAEGTVKVEEETNVTDDVQTAQPDFVTADQIGGTPLGNVTADGTILPQKKKVNKTLVIVLVFVVIFGGVMLLMNIGNNEKNNNNSDGQQGEEKIKVNTGTDWGDKYLTYLMTNKKELKTYEISFINVDDTEIPEMFVKYIDNSNKESMRIFFIADDGYVYESKYYRDYKIRYIYSLKDKSVDWYLFLTTSGNYGSYTKINKIINNMAFDADIKVTTDALKIEYGKKYVDSEYQVTFYTIKELSMENDFKNFVDKYESYNNSVIETKNNILDKYKDVEYVPDEKENSNIISITGLLYNYGSYYSNIPANIQDNIPEYISVITLMRDNRISVNGMLYTYTVDPDARKIEFGNNDFITLAPDKFNYRGYDYVYIENQ